MKVITVDTPFKFADGGIYVTAYAEGEHVVSDRCAEVAVANKWAKMTKKDPEKVMAERKNSVDKNIEG
jgi:hypothetical protein